MGHIDLAHWSGWLRVQKHPKKLSERKSDLFSLCPSVFQNLFPPRAREPQKRQKESECAWGVKGGRKNKIEDTATERGPRKIFNPNNEHCHFLPQSAFPVNFPGQAGRAKNDRALCLTSVNVCKERDVSWGQGATASL